MTANLNPHNVLLSYWFLNPFSMSITYSHTAWNRFKKKKISVNVLLCFASKQQSQLPHTAPEITVLQTEATQNKCTSIFEVNLMLCKVNNRYTSVPLKFIFGNGIGTGIKVLLQGVHLSAQNVSESFHFCKFLTQPVPLLSKGGGRRRDANRKKII